MDGFFGTSVVPAKTAEVEVMNTVVDVSADEIIY
jgi:hypothetical protein